MCRLFGLHAGRSVVTATFWLLEAPDITHSCLLDGRIFAHNGVVQGLDVLDERLHQVGGTDLVLCQTDSERVFATEKMNSDPQWQLIAPGELIHVDAELHITRDLVFPNQPKFQLDRGQLSSVASAAQHPPT